MQSLHIFVAKLNAKLMGAMHETIQVVTAKDIAKTEGVNIATIRFRWNAAFAKGTFDSNRELSPEEIAAISRNSPGKKTASRPAKPAAKDIRTPAHITVNQPAPDDEALPPAPGRAKFELPTFHNVHRFLISALLFTVVVMHGLLIWYDCSVLWDTPGQIGGGTVFIVVFAALLLAADPTLPRTSGNALAFIFFVDCAAWKVHYEVFKTPVVDNIVTGSLCAFICAASFIALYLFRDSKLD